MDGAVFLLHRIRFHCCRCCSVLWLWSSDSGRVSAVLFASLPLACSRSLSLFVSYSLTHLLLSQCHPTLALSFSTPGFFSIFLPCPHLLLPLSFSLYYYTLCIFNISPFLSRFPVSRLGHEDGYSPLLLLHSQCWEGDWRPAVLTPVSQAPISTAPRIREAERQAGLNAE